MLRDRLTSSFELPAGLRLRPLEQSDRERILAVVDEWWGRPMPALVPRPFFSHFRATSFAIEREGELVAFLIGFFSQTNRDESYIHAVGVSPACRGRGLGRFLYERFFDVVARGGRRRVRAITSPANAGSIEFHRRLGFTVAVPDPDAGDDACVELVLELAPPSQTLELAVADSYAAATALRVPLEGELVALEPLERRHEIDLWPAAEDSDWSFMPIDGGASRAAFGRWLDRVLKNSSTEPSAPFAVVRRDSGRSIGSTTYHAIHPEHLRLEIGMTWFARSQWQGGANVEAKLLMLEHAFALGFRRVEFKTDARNTRSRRALEALPAQFEGVFRKHMLVRGGETRDSAYFSVIDDDWPQVRANLARRLASKRAGAVQGGTG